MFLNISFTGLVCLSMNCKVPYEYMCLFLENLSSHKQALCTLNLFFFGNFLFQFLILIIYCTYCSLIYFHHIESKLIHLQIFWTLFPDNATLFTLAWIPGSWQVLSWPHWCSGRQVTDHWWSWDLVVCWHYFARDWTFQTWRW